MSVVGSGQSRSPTGWDLDFRCHSENAGHMHEDRAFQSWEGGEQDAERRGWALQDFYSFEITGLSQARYLHVFQVLVREHRLTLCRTQGSATQLCHTSTFCIFVRSYFRIKAAINLETLVNPCFPCALSSSSGEGQWPWSSVWCLWLHEWFYLYTYEYLNILHKWH